VGDQSGESNEVEEEIGAGIGESGMEK